MNYGKNKLWWVVMYNENMREGWQDSIEELLQMPFAYCVHDKGLELEELKDDGDHRKVHTHIMIAFNGNTTYKHVMEVFSALNASHKRAFNTVQPIYNPARAYDYLIHNTDDSIKKGKYLFPKEARVEGNNFDIGDLVQVSTVDKDEMFDDLTEFVLDNGFTNFADFIQASLVAYSEKKEICRSVIKTYSGYFDRLTKGIYLRMTAKLPADKVIPEKKADEEGVNNE